MQGLSIAASRQQAAGAFQPLLMQTERRLHCHFPVPMQMLSWAIVGGGSCRSQDVLWCKVGANDLRPPVDAVGYLQQALDSAHLKDAVGLLTSADLSIYSHRQLSLDTITAGAIVTVGMGNALRIGDPPGVQGRIGTINILSWTNAALSLAAQLEAMSLIAEARTAAVLASGIASRRSGLPATGTGTDCTILATGVQPRKTVYSGKHTALGHLVGATVLGALEQSLELWQQRYGGPCA